MNISNQIAIISGGASGMGAETARSLSKNGAKVALLDRNFSGKENFVKEINALAVECDVSDAKNVETAVEKVQKELGIPSINVNCAGIAEGEKIVGKDGPMQLEKFAKIININLIGTFNVMRCVAALMTKNKPNEEQERGVIINVASVAAYEGQIGQVAYSASKGGIVSMTLPAARELARDGIRVVTIAPGLIDTPLFSGLPENVQQSLNESVPFPKRLGKTSEFAMLVKSIIENPYLNGCVIRLDGAIRMHEK